MNNYTVTASEAMMQVEAETPEQAAEIATDGIKEILIAHVTPGTPEYPSEMNVRDNKTGNDFGFSL